MRNVQVGKQLFCRLQPNYKRYKLLANYSKQCVNRVMLPRFQGPIEAGSPTYLSIQPSPDSLTEIHQSILIFMIETSPMLEKTQKSLLFQNGENLTCAMCSRLRSQSTFPEVLTIVLKIRRSLDLEFQS